MKLVLKSDLEGSKTGTREINSTEKQNINMKSKDATGSVQKLTLSFENHI